MRFAKTMLLGFIAGLLALGCATQGETRKERKITTRKAGGSDKKPDWLAQYKKSIDTSKITYGGGDGSSQDNAVVIQGAPNSASGVRAESIWARRNHPTWRKTRQSLVRGDGKRYDRIDFTTASGEKHVLFFDITDFFGK
jgi:hypothetical protein